MNTNKKRAIILGAGPAGLVTAWRLLEDDWFVDIYEKEAAVGGMCRTWKWGDFLVEPGPHIYHTPDKELAKFWRNEFGDLFIKCDCWCKNVKGKNFDEYWDYPLSWESISRYPKELKAKILKEIENLNSEKKSQAKNYAEFIEAQVGPTLRKIFFEKYPEKIWGIPTKEMVTEWAPKRFEFRQKVTPFYHKQFSAVGKYGAGCVYERIKEKILKLGGAVYLNSEVKGIVSQGNVITAIEIKDREIVKVNSRDIVISTLPVTLTAGFLGYKSSLQFRGIRSVYLAYNKRAILPRGVHVLYYDSQKVCFNRISEAKKFSPYMAPENKSYICAEIAFSRGNEIDIMDSKALIKRLAKQVEMVGLVKAGELIDACSHSEYFVYPLQYLGYRNELSRTRAAISKFQQLYTLGTGGDFYYADSQILFHKAFDLAQILCGRDSSHAQVIKQAPRCRSNGEAVINGRKIGTGSNAYIIAEAGLNHNGSVAMAKQLIDQAKAAGADSVKFQTFKPSNRISKKIKAVKYAETIIGMEETLFEMFERLAMGPEEQKEIFAYARDKDIEVFSTPFDFESADFLNSLGVNVFKIASMDIVNIPFIKYVASMGKPMILSTGMASLGQIEEAVEAVIGQSNSNLMLLHCNSSYPAAQGEMNLNVIKTLKQSFGVPVGLSDHTIGLFVSQTALAIGADLIERHFTLNRMLEGPDHILSSEPRELAELAAMSKKIPLVLGDGVKRIQPSEYDTLNIQRKSLYAACDIRKGDIVTKDMITIKGPGGGILPKYQDIIIGRPARADIEEDYPITWEAV